MESMTQVAEFFRLASKLMVNADEPLKEADWLCQIQGSTLWLNGLGEAAKTPRGISGRKTKVVVVFPGTV